MPSTSPFSVQERQIRDLYWTIYRIREVGFDVRSSFATEDYCLTTIGKIVFTDAFPMIRCQSCERTQTFSRVKNRTAFYCPNCGFQIYPLRSTVLYRSHTSVLDWFRILIELIEYPPASAKHIERRTGIPYNKIRHVTGKLKGPLVAIRFNPPKWYEDLKR